MTIDRLVERIERIARRRREIVTELGDALVDCEACQRGAQCALHDPAIDELNTTALALCDVYGEARASGVLAEVMERVGLIKE